MKKEKTAKLIVILLAVLMSLALCACGSKKDDNSKSSSKADSSRSDNVQTDYASLYEYAQKLEKDGDNDAAAAVYEIIVRNGGKDLANSAREQIDLMQTMDEINEISEIFGEGGDAK